MLGHVSIDDLGDPYGKAIKAQRRLIHKDRSADNINYLAGLLTLDGKHNEALTWLERGLCEFPINPTAKYLKGLILLAGGDFAEGFKLYEYRFAAYPDNAKVDRLCKKWHGECTDKVVYIWHDGGVGDAIQFVRYFPEVLRRAPNAKLLVNPHLIYLFSHNGVSSSCMPRTRDDFDKDFSDKLACSIQSLPAMLGVTSVSGEPYIKPSDTAIIFWTNVMKDKPRIGFCWRGNPDHERDATRSIPNEIAMEFGEKHDMLSLMGEHLKSKCWDDTAAVIASLDLVISVDTSIAHLAGAMGKPTWILLPVDFDWRWMRHKARSPWYNSVRLFRCPVHGDWRSALHDVSEGLTYRARHEHCR